MLIYNGLKIKTDDLGLALWNCATCGCQNLNQQYSYFCQRIEQKFSIIFSLEEYAKDFNRLYSYFLHTVRISEILPWDRKSYLTHAILPRTSSEVIMRNCILAYSRSSGSLF